ncbi:MAG: ParB/RepB/Spo0J family partition protein [Opitutaceae bacterium]|jgi:ParB family chromosome partitioning protein|nr:ParB/RepB/Spo0J family partition protein [Opitutaceae bacterium]
MANSKSRLGRGLGGLIAAAAPAKPAAPSPATPPSGASAAQPAPAAATPPPAPNGFVELAVTAIVPSPYQARKEIAPEQLQELAESIRAEGLLQPVVVRKQSDGKYQLIAGERRWRAFQLLKIKTIPARLVVAGDASSAALGLIENLQREGLNPLEEAYGYASLIRDFDLTQEAAAERVGKPRASVANTLRLLTLDGELQGYLAKGLLSVGHAKVLLGVEDTPQRALMARRVIEEGLSVRATENLVQARKNLAAGSVSSSGAGAAKKLNPADAAAISSIEKRLTSHLGARVAVQHAGKKGKIVIPYAGNDDLQRILEKLGVEL